MSEFVEFQKDVDDGLELTVVRMTFGKGRLCLGPKDAPWYDDMWCYPTLTAALAAAREWDGVGDAPVGWHRHPPSGRRREDGDPSREVVRW